jgi:hypothetical protein
MLARTFSFSRGLDFSLAQPRFFSQTLSGYADRFCGFLQKRSASAFPAHILPCYHFKAIHYQFFVTGRLLGQIAIHFLGRQTGRRKKIAIQPVSLSFPAQSISKSEEKIRLS